MINILLYIGLFLLLYFIIFPIMIWYFGLEKMTWEGLKQVYYLIFNGEV